MHSKWPENIYLFSFLRWLSFGKPGMGNFSMTRISKIYKDYEYFNDICNNYLTKLEKKIKKSKKSKESKKSNKL